MGGCIGRKAQSKDRRREMHVDRCVENSCRTKVVYGLSGGRKKISFLFNRVFATGEAADGIFEGYCSVVYNRNNRIIDGRIQG